MTPQEIKNWFNLYGGYCIKLYTLDGLKAPSIESLYQLFKARMLEEMKKEKE